MEIRIVVVTAFALSLVMVAPQQVCADGEGGDRKPIRRLKLTYQPPMRGKPGRRSGGGTRAQGEDVPRLAALVPDHIGLTVSAQPTLYWWLSGGSRFGMELTIIDDESIDPLVEAELPAPAQGGIHGFDLAKHDVRLKPGVEYEWFISIVPNPDRRSADVVATGKIKRIKSSERFDAQLATADAAGRVEIFAAEGLWYDTLGALSRMILERPKDAALEEARQSLLDQAGLLKEMAPKSK